MTLQLYMNHHVPAAVTDGLRLRGVDVLPAYEDGAARHDDDRLLTRAGDLGRVLYSQDEDLLAIAEGRLRSGEWFAGLIYGPQRKLTVGQAVQDLEVVAKACELAEMHNRVQFIPL